MSTCRRIQIDPYLSLCTKLKSMWIKGLNIKLHTLDVMKVGNKEQKLTAQELRLTNKSDLMKLKTFCKAKDTIYMTKLQLTQWENIFIKPTSDRGMIPKIH